MAAAVPNPASKTLGIAPTPDQDSPLPSLRPGPEHQHGSLSTSIASTAQNIFQFAIPSILKQTTAPTSSRPINPIVAAQRASTNCLDGLRGVAAFAVMIFHFSMPIYPSMQQGYGFIRKDGTQNTNLLALPLIKVWYSGGFAVFLFFVISGYVLAVNIVRSMNERKTERILPALSSLAFRRTARLFVPSVMASFVAFVCHRLGISGQPPNYGEPGFIKDTMYYLRSVRDVFTFYSWNTEGRMWHLSPLWTIPVEFRCSMVLFLVLLALSRCRRKIRLVIEGLLLIDTWVHDRWDVGCFILGLVAAELHVDSQMQDPEFGKVMEEEHLMARMDEITPRSRHLRQCSEPILSISEPRKKSLLEDPKFVKQIGLWAMFVLGLYLGSMPTIGGCATPGFAPLCALTFQKEQWRYVMLPAGFLVVLSILYLPSLQRPLNSKPARYLGKVSYAMYLMHELVHHIIGGKIKNAVWEIMGREGLSYHFGYVVIVAILVTISLWVADMFMRAIDIPATKFARKMEEYCLEKDDQSVLLQSHTS